jgi:hypothetical protein
VVFDVYGRFRIEVLREDGRWVLRRLEPGRRMILRDLVIPDDTPAEQIPRVLEDLLHEFAAPDRRIRPLEQHPPVSDSTGAGEEGGASAEK